MPGSEADLGFSGEGQSLLASWGEMDKLSRLSILVGGASGQGRASPQPGGIGVSFLKEEETLPW